MGCLDETTIARLLDRSISPAESALVIRHIDDCEDCRRVVSALAHGQTRGPADRAIAPELATGSLELSSFARGFAPIAGPSHALDLAPEDDEPLPVQLGRYQVTSRLGRGAMGEVYAARDPELGREVAIKLVHVASGSAGARERVVREAKALAKVSHPNVVAVYDVGTSDGPDVFIAMELLRGGTLRTWLTTPRTLGEIVRVMAQVGRGLAAAHACGLVHRDVKPDNILFTSDGQVRIGDFGLALPLDPEGPRDAAVAPPEPPSDPLIAPTATRPLTQTGTVVGTPAYMAPEQFVDGAVDARSDQFAFCVTLYEAVYGVRPFSGDTVAALADVVHANTRQPLPAGAPRIPRWLRAVLDRGLATDPAARFSSMDALVAALTAFVRRRRTVRGGVLLAAGVSVGVVAVLALNAHSGPAPCGGLGDEITAAWNPQLRAALVAGMRTTGKAFATDSADRVTAIIDRYATAWTAKLRDVCTETRIRGDRSEAALDLRRGCLDRERGELAAVVKTLTTADVAIATQAIDAVSALPSPSRCDDVDALRLQRPPTGDVLTSARFAALDLEFATERALAISGRRDAALPIAQRLVDETRRLDAPSMRTMALLRLAEAVAPVESFEHPRALLEEAIATADRAGLDEQRAEAWAALISTLARRGEALELARTLLPQATAAVERIGVPADPTRDIEWLIAQGALLAQTNDPHAAEAKFRQALARASAALGESSPMYVQAMDNLVKLEQALHAPSARADTEQLVERLAKLYGEHHPDTAFARVTLSESLQRSGDYEGATTVLRGAIRDLVDALGEDDPEVASARSRLAGALMLSGHPAEANVENDRALAIRRKRFHPDNMFITESLGQRGRILGAMNRHAEAITALVEARDRTLAAFGPDDLRVAEAELDLGDEDLQLDKRIDAEGHYRRALAIKEHVLGPDNAGIVTVLISLGAVLVGTHREHEAIAPLERALALQPGDGDPQDLADTRLQLGHAVAATEPKRALELARLALEQYVRGGPPESLSDARALIGHLDGSAPPRR